MSRPLRILIATVAHPPADARIRHREMRALLDRGHNVTYLAPFAAFGAEPFDDVRCLNVPRSRGRRRLGPVLAAARIMWREAAQHDAVLIHDPELLPALLLLRSVSSRPILVWDVHEDVPAQFLMVPWLPRPLGRTAACVARWVERFVESQVRLLLAEHAYAARFRLEHPVVPNSVRVPSTVPAPAGEAGPRLIYIGSITSARGIEEMLTVAARLPAGVRLELIGNAAPDLDARLRSQNAGANVDYRGYVPNDAALQRLPGALAGLSLLHDHANYAHSQPTKAMEYMAYAVPVITTANRASRELVERHHSGFVVDFGDCEAVLARVEELLADPSLARRLGDAGHSAALEHFDWTVDGERFAAQIEQWCGRDAIADEPMTSSAIGVTK